jgi:uncharacterized protein YbaR (Trm112 family)
MKIIYCPHCRRPIRPSEFQGDELINGKLFVCNCSQKFIVFKCCS